MRIEGPLERLPRRAVMVRGETVASYLWRLAELNGMGFEDLARHIGASGTVRAADSGIEEVRLGPVARQRLADASGVAPAHLAQALVSLNDSRISARARRQLEVEPWSEGWMPVQACALCAAGRGERPVWRVPGGQWAVCVRHRRWTALERGRVQVGLELLPESAGCGVLSVLSSLDGVTLRHRCRSGVRGSLGLWHEHAQAVPERSHR